MSRLALLVLYSSQFIWVAARCTSMLCLYTLDDGMVFASSALLLLHHKSAPQFRRSANSQRDKSAWILCDKSGHPRQRRTVITCVTHTDTIRHPAFERRKTFSTRFTVGGSSKQCAKTYIAHCGLEQSTLHLLERHKFRDHDIDLYYRNCQEQSDRHTCHLHTSFPSEPSLIAAKSPP